MVKLRRFYVLLLLIAMLVLLFALQRPEVAPLPVDDDVHSIAASVVMGSDSGQVDFQLPLSHWPRVRAALEPSTRDYHPAGWVHRGVLQITTKSQRAVIVLLFDTFSDQPGAFAVGPTVERRVYYRGGDSDRLVKELAAAYAAAQPKSSSQ